MINQLTDAQIARLLELCGEITAVRNELPAAPKGYNVALEIARSLRTSLEQHSAALTELGTILRPGLTNETPNE